ncbi:MAG: hypothetical protein U0736_24260 [Gemmataceae bacterium]
MTTLNADLTLLSYLAPLVKETFIRDSSGRIIGRFTPTADELSAEEVRRLFDPAEMERRRQAHQGKKGLTTQEVLDRLHALPRKENSV